MALFRVRVKISAIAEIPVVADTLESALVYAKNHDDWKEDSALLEATALPESAVVEDAEPVISPKDSPWEGSVLCWGAENEEEVTVATAVLGNPYPNESAYETDEAFEAAWQAWAERHDRIVAEFDEGRGNA